jgi:hypothetical protein
MVKSAAARPDLRIGATARKCRDFRMDMVGAGVLSIAIRASDLLTEVSASSTSVAVRDGIERRQRLLSRTQPSLPQARQ